MKGTFPSDSYADLLISKNLGKGAGPRAWLRVVAELRDTNVLEEREKRLVPAREVPRLHR